MKHAIVTGAATGIGIAVTKILSKKNYRVIAISPQWEDNTALKALKNVTVLVLDLSDVNFLDFVVDYLEKYQISINLLVNNAGVYERRLPQDIDVTLLNDTLKINLIAPFLLSRIAHKRRPNNCRSYIVNIVSDAAFVGSKKGVHYASSKAGLVGMTKSLAKAYGEDGVLVNAVAPGITRTRQSKRSSSEYNSIAKSIPLGRIAEPNDIAETICELASGKFDYLTGAVLNLTGGRYCW